MMSYRSSWSFVPLRWFLRKDLENFAEITYFRYFFSKRFQILSWFLLCELNMMSYKSSLSFVPLCWFLRMLGLQPLDLHKFCRNNSFPDLFSKCFEILCWFLVCESSMTSYRSSASFFTLCWFLLKLRPLDFENSVIVMRATGRGLSNVMSYSLDSCFTVHSQTTPNQHDVSMLTLTIHASVADLHFKVECLGKEEWSRSSQLTNNSHVSLNGMNDASMI